jgi:hypothetical protein
MGLSKVPVADAGECLEEGDSAIAERLILKYWVLGFAGTG